MEKSKSDGLVKSIAAVQAVCLAVQCIARTVQGLEATPLEISTIAYIPISLLSYGFWWCEPFNVRYPIAV